MNILAGRFKGHNIRTVAKASYRPTASRIRKSIFDILGNLNGCSVLDLFAGSGILGFEAASRGAAEPRNDGVCAKPPLGGQNGHTVGHLSSPPPHRDPSIIPTRSANTAS